MKVQVCVAENGLEDKVTVGSAFCLNHCAEGVSVAIDDDIVTGIGQGNVDQLFEQIIKPQA